MKEGFSAAARLRSNARFGPLGVGSGLADQCFNSLFVRIEDASELHADTTAPVTVKLVQPDDLGESTDWPAGRVELQQDQAEIADFDWWGDFETNATAAQVDSGLREGGKFSEVLGLIEDMQVLFPLLAEGAQGPVSFGIAKADMDIEPSLLATLEDLKIADDFYSYDIVVQMPLKTADQSQTETETVGHQLQRHTIGEGVAFLLAGSGSQEQIEAAFSAFPESRIQGFESANRFNDAHEDLLAGFEVSGVNHSVKPVVWPLRFRSGDGVAHGSDDGKVEHRKCKRFG